MRGRLRWGDEPVFVCSTARLLRTRQDPDRKGPSAHLPYYVLASSDEAHLSIPDLFLTLRHPLCYGPLEP